MSLSTTSPIERNQSDDEELFRNERNNLHLMV